MTLREVLHKRDDALMEILDQLKGKKLYKNLWVQLKFFWQDTKRAVYCATPWKDAQGEDLPEIDEDVIVLTQPYPLEGSEYAVSFGHRPNPDGWDRRSITTGDIKHYTPETYDKGGWNIPDVKWWLDIELPKEK